MAKSSFFYSVQMEKHTGGIESITVMVFAEKDNVRPNDENIKFHYQRNTDDNKMNNWYGGDMSINTRGHDIFTKHVTLAKRIINAMPYSDIYYGLEVLNYIRSKGTQVVYDSRLSEYITLDEVMPEDYKRFLDHYGVMDRPACTYSVLARDYNEAARMIMVKAAERNNTDFIKQFIACDQPTKIDNWGSYPNIHNLNEIMSNDESENE